MALLDRLRPSQTAPLPNGTAVGARWGALARQRRTSVGVDFGAGAIKVAQIRWTRQGPRLENYAVVPVPPGRMDEGAIKDSGTMGELLRNVLTDMGVTQTLVGTSLGGPNILMRYINLPKVSPEEMRSAMKFEAPQHLPIPEDQLVYDFTPVPEATGVPEHQMAVFLSGTHKKLVESFLGTLNRAGLRTNALELDCLTALRAVQWIGMVSHTTTLPMVLLDFGEMETSISIMRYGVPMLARTIPTGLHHLRVAVSDSMHISAGEAEMALRLKGVKPDLDLAPAVEPWLNSLMESVGRSIEFFLIQNRGATVEQVLLMGGGSLLPNLPEALTSYLQSMLTGRPEAENLRVQPVGLAGLDMNPDLLPGVNSYGPLLMGALGSALREGSPE
ncbi:MAG TPA: type IV pilus assembly protein PilM [Symbiobacteriaceae bacterium]|jgi:type IV pilus assembly protein PilM|nr:type IV pilus assembly protein PilM [Symbiobacteriaceae bacterium]